VEHELAQEGAVHAVLHLACQSKDRACYDCENWLERLEDARAAVKKKSDNNVVSAALQAKWMDYDIKAKVQALAWQRTRQPEGRRSWSYWPCTLDA
jgi:hypothetical protein